MANASAINSLLFAGCAPDDDEDLRRRKAVLTGTSLAKCSFCPIWYGSLIYFDAPLAAIGPLGYQVATIISVLVFFRRRDFAAFRTRQALAILLGPWFVHVTMGGFAAADGIILWSLLSPLTALLFHGARESVPWFAAFIGLVVFSGLIEPLHLFPAVHVTPPANIVFLVLNLVTPSALAYLAVRYFAFLVDREKAIHVALNAEISDLNRRLSAENKRLGSEVDIARKLQLMVLPPVNELEAVPNLDIAAFMRPADEVGGDYYDVLRLGDRIKIGIGDVTGHGLESGVVMLMVQSVARSLMDAGEYDPVRYLTLLNQVIFKNIQRIGAEKNLTLAFLDFVDDRVQLSGQHEDVVILRANGELERIDTAELGFPIGLEADISDFIQVQELAFHRGDCILLYTDGVTEAENSDRELFGVDRLLKSLEARRHLSAAKIREGVIEDLLDFIGDQRIYDDISLVVVKRD